MIAKRSVLQEVEDEFVAELVVEHVLWMRNKKLWMTKRDMIDQLQNFLKGMGYKIVKE